MTQRLFVGLRLPADVAATLYAAGECIRATDARWADEKWVPRENLHVTTAFLGNVADDIVAPLTESISADVAASGPISLTFARISAVPGVRRCRMIWAAFDDACGSAAALANAIRSSASALDIGVDEKPFRAHVTLARARHPHPLDPTALTAADQQVSRSAQSVSDPAITLFTSRLTPRGPLYGEIATWHVVGG